MRELIEMLSNPDSPDNLGIGEVRDAFEDLLIPGISTVQTRARYLRALAPRRRAMDRHVQPSRTAPGRSHLRLAPAWATQSDP